MPILLILLFIFGCSSPTEDVSPPLLPLEAGVPSAVLPDASALENLRDAEVDGSFILDARVLSDSESFVEAASPVVETTSFEFDAGALTTLEVDSGPPPVECRIEAGFCNPMCTGQCGDKTCGYTPDRTEDFMCVYTGTVGLYSLCSLDDDCQDGLVCESHVCKKPCRMDDDCAGFDLFGEPASYEISGGDLNDRVIKDVCQPVTRPDGERQIGLRVCNRVCRSALDKICGEDSSFSTVFCDGIEGSRTLMCQAKWVEPEIISDAGLVALSQLQSLKAVGDPCTGHEECGDLLCSSGTCKESCLSPQDCGGLACDVDDDIGSGVCNTPCAVDPGSPCSVSLNCGCPQGESCKVQADQTSACFPSGDNTTQAWCNFNKDCASGLSCVAGLCRSVCESDQDCESQGRCLKAVSGPIADIWVCSGECDPITGLGCGLGALCYPAYGEPAVCTAEASGVYPHSKGHACSGDDECASGLGCVQNTCQPWCRSDEGCEDSVCVFFEPNRYGVSSEDRVGICTP